MVKNNCELNRIKIEIDADMDIESNDYNISEIETFKRKSQNSNIEVENDEIHSDIHEIIRELLVNVEEINDENRIKCQTRTHNKQYCEKVEVMIIDKELRNGNSIKCETSSKRKISVDDKSEAAVHPNKTIGTKCGEEIEVNTDPSKRNTTTQKMRSSKPRTFSLLKDINEKEYKPLKPWLTRSNCNKKSKFLRTTRKALDLLSGGDTAAMCSEILRKEEKCTIAKKYIDVLKGFAKIYNKVNLKERYEYIKPLKEAKFKRAEARRLGFNVGKNLWNNCLEERTVINYGGGQSIADEIKEDVEKYMESISSIASNKFLKKQSTHAFIRHVTVSEAYESYPNKHKLAISTFRKIVNEKFKKPHRMSDLCDYCEHGKELKKDIISKANSYGYEIKSNDNDFDLDKLKQYFESLPRSSRGSINYILDLTIQKIDDLKEIKYHRLVATKQREIYNQMRQDKELLKKSLIIEIDFKQKIALGKGPREVNSDFYNQEFRSFLGFGIYYTNENDEIDCLNMDIVFPNTNQDCFAVINAIKFIRKQKIFQEIDRKHYIFWTDCGMHFRSSEFIDFLFNDLAKEDIQVNWNMFCEKHGKNARDQHFSVVSHFLDTESKARKLTTTTDIADTIRKRQQLSNVRRINSGMKPILHWIDEIPSDMIEAKPKKVKYKKIEFLKCLYNLRNDDDFVLKTSIFSYGEKLLNIDSLQNKFFLLPRSESSFKKSEKDCENSEERIEEKPIVKIDYLRNKRLFIENELLNVNTSMKNSSNNEIENNKDVNDDQYNQTLLNSCNNQEISVQYCNYSNGITDSMQLLSDVGVNFLGESVENTSSFVQIVHNDNDDDLLNQLSLCLDDNQKPNYCTDACTECSKRCEYKTGNLNTLPQTLVNEELKRHGHPSSRRIKGKMRNTVQARIELIEHYKYCHKQFC